MNYYLERRMVRMNAIRFYQDKNNAAYVAISALMLLWYKKIATPLGQMERLVFVIAISVGILCFSVIMDRSEKFRRHARTAILASCIITIGMTAILFCPKPISYIALCLSGIFIGAAFILQHTIGMRQFPYEYRCRSFGFSFALAGFINTTTDLTELPFLRVGFPEGGYVMAITVLSLAAIIFAVCTNRKERDSWSAPKINRSYAVVAAMATAVACIAYVVFGFKDSAAYPDALAVVAPSGFLRYIEVPLFIGIGWLCDKMGRQVILLTSLCTALLGSAGILFHSSPVISTVMELCSFISIISISTSICVILADLSHYAKYPTLMIGLGFAPTMMGQALSFQITVLTSSDAMVLFVVAFVPGVLLIPLVMALLERTRMVYAAGVLQKRFLATDDAPQKYNLSKRETQVYELILESKTVPEMAQLLYLTESTVKQHITNILRKTGMKSRSQILVRMGGAAVH